MQTIVPKVFEDIAVAGEHIVEHLVDSGDENDDDDDDDFNFESNSTTHGSNDAKHDAKPWKKGNWKKLAATITKMQAQGAFFFQ